MSPTDERNVTWQTKHPEYADNLTLITTNTEEATKALNNLQQYLLNISMTISIPKTKVLIIKKRNNQSKITIDDNQIGEMNIFHYLVLAIVLKEHQMVS